MMRCRTSSQRLGAAAAFWLALTTASSSVAHAEGACSDPALKDVFIQGGEQVIDAGAARITALSHDEVVEQSPTSLSCRYLMELSNSSKRWVRFSYTLDAEGQASIDYEEEAASTAR